MFDADRLLEVLTMAGQLGLGLGILVFIHELGHFMAARAFGIKVDKFYVFFDFGDYKLFSKKIGDTEYGLGWFPLGGYVKIAGMIDESQDKDQMKKEPGPDDFRSKPAWQRFIVMIGGIVMNLILGVIIFAFYNLYYAKDYYIPDQISDGIYAHELAEKVGLQSGDVVVGLNGNPLERAKELVSPWIVFKKSMTVIRDGETVEVTMPDSLFKMFKESGGPPFISITNYPFTVDSVHPETPDGEPTFAYEIGLEKEDKILAINDNEIKVFGDVTETLVGKDSTELQLTVLRGADTVTLGPKLFTSSILGFRGKGMEYPTKKYTVGSAIRFGIKDGWESIYYNAVALSMIFTGEVNPVESIQSPIGIAVIYGPRWEWDRFWLLTGLISFILAFMNFLPIPALDGGHVVFILLEVIRGKPVNEDIQEKAQLVGMVLLLLIMVFAIGKDAIVHFFD